MTDDIVEKARELGEPTTTTGQLWLDLADEIGRLRELLEEAAEELTTIFDMAYPDRTDYSDEMRRWKRDMDLVYRIKDAIRNQP